MELSAYLRALPRTALAFSGGVDSAYLLWAAKDSGCDVRAYYVHSAFQPAFELADAKRLAQQIGVPLTVVEANILDCPEVRTNPADRCYHCKHALFSLLWEAARQDGCSVLLDGTNASDDTEARPGMRALGELSVRSPLRECGLTKDEVRVRSRAAGLFTWDKPAFACLATRVPTGTAYTEELLHGIEEAENAVFALGFTDFRVRIFAKAARLQFTEDQMNRALEQRQALVKAIKPWFAPVLLDLETR